MNAPQDVDGLITKESGELLQKLAGTVPVGQVIVEIGAFLGRSTCYLASGAKPEVPVISIDPHGMPGSERGRGGRFAGEKVRARYLKNIEGYAAVRPVRALSRNAPVPTEPIGLLWIDGAHDFASVQGDVERFASLVAPGGHIVIDDYRTHHRGVDRVVKTLVAEPWWADWQFTPTPLAWARRV
jgi:predicted O-methyltransferase YrrM